MGKRRCYEAEFQRDWSNPGEWGIEWTQSEGKRRFQSLHALSKASEVGGVGGWEWSSHTIYAYVRQDEWEMGCDDEGRSCRDWFEVARCGGTPLSWAERQRLGRLVGILDTSFSLAPSTRQAYQAAWKAYAPTLKLRAQTREL